MSSARVTLLGGSGFVGSELTARLSQQFDEVVILTRRAQRVRTVRVMPNVTAVETNVHDAAALSEALQGSDVVINLIGILNESGSAEKNSFQSAHADLTSKVLDACSTAGVNRYLHVSALHADAENGSSEYLKSKGAAENHIKASKGINWTIFRPSIIFGKGDAFFNRFAGLLRAMPVFPLAVPDARMAPVHIGDVCDAMISAINDSSTTGETIELVGPEEYTLRELVQYTCDVAGIDSKIIGLPDWAARLQARVMEWVPGKPFTRDNYQSLQTDSVGSAGTKPQATSLDAVVPRYLGANDWAGQLQKRRAGARR